MSSNILNLKTIVDSFDIVDNCLCVGGKKITDLVREVGSSPIYIYDKDRISKRISALRKCLPKDVELHYAIKANPMPEVVKFIATMVDGLDVASAGELHTALQFFQKHTDISFAGPGKTIGELDAAINASITINAESPTELQRIDDACDRLGRLARVAIRVNPDFELKSSGMKMSGGPKQFGIDAEVVPDILRNWPRKNLQFVGFHIFSGSQNLRPDSICESQRNAFALAKTLNRFAPRPAEIVNIGGGFGIPYFAGDKPLPLNEISTTLEELSTRAKSELGGARLVIELGRYIVAEAGIYVCEVIDRKMSRGQVFLITNGGMHHHLAASGNFGQIIRKNFPVTVGNRIGQCPTETATVVGPLCTPLDLLGDRIEVPVANIGDLIVVFQSGAYGFTASPHKFLGHPPPVEVLT